MPVLKSKNPRTPDINNIEEFENVVNDILGEYVDSFTEESGLAIRGAAKIRDFCNDHEISEDIRFGFIITKKGEEMLDRQVYRLKCLGKRKFGTEPNLMPTGMTEFI